LPNAVATMSGASETSLRALKLPERIPLADLRISLFGGPLWPAIFLI